MARRERRPFEYLLVVAEDYFKYNDMVLRDWFRYGRGGIDAELLYTYFVMRERFHNTSNNAQQLIRHYDTVAEENAQMEMQPVAVEVVAQPENNVSSGPQAKAENTTTECFCCKGKFTDVTKLKEHVKVCGVQQPPKKVATIKKERRQRTPKTPPKPSKPSKASKASKENKPPKGVSARTIQRKRLLKNAMNLKKL